jgi:hypothetical protein
MVSLVLYAP